MDTLTVMSGYARRSEAIMAVMAAAAFIIMLLSAYNTIKSSVAVTTETETTLQWASDTASWKGGW